MKTEKLIQFALKQSVIILTTIAAVPVIAIVTTLLLATISSLFCEQLPALMTLTVVVTTSTLAVIQFRGDTNTL